MQQYSQLKALWAITKASLIAIFRSPQSVFFGIFFPIVLIVIFGALGGSGSSLSVDVGIDSKSDTSNAIYTSIKNSPLLNINNASQDTLEDFMNKGKLTALIQINKIKGNNGSDTYDVHLRSSSANQLQLPALQSVLNGIISTLDKKIHPDQASIASTSVEEVQGREYKAIDFYLPGMIGFSLIGLAVFGVSFLFFNLRETLVLKRLYSSPINRLNIILGETLSRVIFQMITVFILILFGRFFYHFTLANGAITFIEMIFVSLLGLIVFMGAGFVISGIAKNQNIIPIYSNLFMFPQYFLSGSFFSTNVFPKNIQWILKALPLTALNDALRKISFEGAGIIDCWAQFGILLGWGIVLYFIAVKTFRWE
ncbi:MAG TPA: ABC transporter permease [Ferruginibacter sp.]|nr:ABC transporter permease [Ferruginibacter sp.]